MSTTHYDIVAEKLEAGRLNMYNRAVETVRDSGKTSTSYLQRALQIGFSQAENLMEEMEKNGIVSEPNHIGKRTVL